MLYSFDEDWNDIKKLKSEWCRQQARLLHQNIWEECYPIRYDKLKDVLQEMAKKDYATATSGNNKFDGTFAIRHHFAG